MAKVLIAIFFLCAPLASTFGDVSQLDRFWQRCANEIGESKQNQTIRVRYFGRTERTADLLLDLIRNGEKTVTFTSPWIYDGDPNATPVIGGYTVVTDFAGRPSLVLKTTEVYTKPFQAISEQDSQYEGPGARPLEAWRRIHWDFFTDVLAPSGRSPAEDMPVTVERFEVVCPKTRTLSLAQLEDKVRGGWAGQMIGVSYGYPTEFGYLEETIPDEVLPTWQPDMVVEALNQDDLYVDITFSQVLDEKGLDATSEDFAELFRTAGYSLWHANLAARRALRRGVPAHLSGTPAHNIHFNDIDFQIEADFIGLMSPGLPQATNELSLRAGRVMNYGDGVHGGMFISAMYAAAFFEQDPKAVVRAGLGALPETSDYARVIGDVLGWANQFPGDWDRSWNAVHERWGGDEICPAGALHPFNIDAKINGAYVAMALLYGDGDFFETMKLATQAGQDSDCNPATAAGIVGVMLGFDGIPNEYTEGIEAIADTPFSFTDYSFEDIVASTLKRAIALVEREGGDVSDDVLTIPWQEPQPADPFPDVPVGRAKERISFDDARWQWKGHWRRVTQKIWRYERTSMVASEGGAEAFIRFEGTGAAVTGLLLPSGGKVTVFVDGERVAEVDAYPDEPNTKADEALWHVFGLEPGPHELRLRVIGERFGASQGTDISIMDLIVFD